MAFSDEATIYVADNASTDNSIEVIQNQFHRLKSFKTQAILALQRL